MKIAKSILAALLPIAILASCGEKDEPAVQAPAPVLVGTKPENGAVDIDVTKVSVVLSFDQNIKSPLDRRQLIQIAPEASISSVGAFGKDLTITLEGLKYGTKYSLEIGEGAVCGFDANQKPAAKVSMVFTTKSAPAEPEPEVNYELAPVKELSNPNATAQARNVYNFLLSNNGKKTLTGVQAEGTANNNGHVDLIAEKTGKHPALAGYDFIFLQYSPTPSDWSWIVNYSDISAAKSQWENNGLVSYMWHWNVPNSKADWDKGTGSYDFGGYNFYSDKTSFSITEALKEGTWQHDFIMKDMEKVAGYLKMLQDAGVPVIWRPLHEAAGNYNLYGIRNNAWFWWGRGGAEACKQLYRLMRDTFEKKYGLNNLIWVWTLDAVAGAKDEWASWYPGDDYVDIVGVDIYANDTEKKQEQYQACVNLTKGRKLVTISECGNVPDPEKCHADGEAWSWFMVWSSTDYSLNTDNYWKQLMSGSHSLTREDMPSLK